MLAVCLSAVGLEKLGVGFNMAKLTVDFKVIVPWYAKVYLWTTKTFTLFGVDIDTDKALEIYASMIRLRRIK